MKIKKIISLLFVSAVIALVSCKKDKTYVYEVNNTTVTQNSSTKKNVKTTIEFISIAYSDLFGSTINNSELNKLSLAYDGFGDKRLIEQMIIKDFLNEPTAKVPTKTTMKSDVSKFVSDTYVKFYNRAPNDFELWSIKNIINSDTVITPALVYFAVMTSNEYRYY